MAVWEERKVQNLALRRETCLGALNWLCTPLCLAGVWWLFYFFYCYYPSLQLRISILKRFLSAFTGEDNVERNGLVTSMHELVGMGRINWVMKCEYR
ncbi:hypothetical protein EYC80_000241 [Monilinia laxa]|uniref:Uncharacterized protein n=1 Tax=Monilinia laxa TaxID=61186 RepID=A0A5N6KA48_MONLA|nr:hypothetical protein EYC80_000241 [Monilinia laxa]